MIRSFAASCFILGPLLACGSTLIGEPQFDLGGGSDGPLDVPDSGPDSDLGGIDFDGGAPAGPCGAAIPAGNPEITIGTGRDAFRPVCPGDELEWVAGGQGSFHLEGGVRIDPAIVAELSPEERSRIKHEYVVTDLLTAGEASRERIDDADTPFPVFRPGPDGGLETFDVFLVIEAAWQGLNPDPSFAAGRDLEYEVFVTLPDGTRYRRSVEVTSSCCR